MSATYDGQYDDGGWWVSSSLKAACEIEDDDYDREADYWKWSGRGE